MQGSVRSGHHRFVGSEARHQQRLDGTCTG